MTNILNLLPTIISGTENPLTTISKSVGITGTFDTGANLDVDTSAEVLTSTDFDTTQGVIITADSDNSGTVFIGNSDVDAGSTDATSGIPITAGESIFFSASNPNVIYVIGSAVNQKVYWLAV